METKPTNPDVQKSLKECDIATIKYQYYKRALDNITDLKNKLKREYKLENSSVFEVMELLEKNTNHAEKDMERLHKELSKLRSKCNHDFKFSEESYTGNFDYYVCTKCGAVKSYKA